MRVLLYNWIPFDDTENRGGGIRLYQSNLIKALIAQTHTEIHTLHSGLDHPVRPGGPSWIETVNDHPGRVTSYSILNSSVPAPGHISFANTTLFDENHTYEAFVNFLEVTGPYDVVHFDSTEGVPLSCLAAPKRVWPQAQVTLYCHNYHSVCPQVNLWHDESSNCLDFRNGEKCVSCLPVRPKPDEVVDAYRLSWLLRQNHITPGTRRYGVAYRGYGAIRSRPGAFRLARRAVELARSPSKAIPDPIRGKLAIDHHAGARHGEPIVLLPSDTSALHDAGGAAPDAVDDERNTDGTGVSIAGSRLGERNRFRDRRVRSTELINTHIDRVLATSHRTAEVLEKFGVAHDKIQVCYLGTEAAGSADPAERRYDRLDEDSLTIGYLGYLRRDKGFYFLLDALERAPDSLLARLRLVIAAVLHDEEVVERLTLLKERMQAIVLYDGYHHDQLGEILGRIDLGVIPVLWEDNLPQVAIEMVSAGLPLLTSDLGGAQELGGNNPAFVFEAGQAESLHQRLGAIADRRVELGRYWDQAMTPVTMSAHLEALDAIWTGRTPPAAAAPPRRPTAADGPRDPGTQRSASAPDVALRQERPTGHSVGDAGDATDSDSDGDGLSESGAAGEQTEPPEPEQPEPVQPEPVQPVERYASSEGAGPEPTSSDPKEDGAEDPEEGSAPPPPIEPGRPPTIERVTDPLPGRPHEKFKSAITLWTNHQQGEPGPPSDEGDPDARR